MRHDNWHNLEYMNNRRFEMVEIAKSIIDNKINIIEGVRKITSMRFEVTDDESDPDFQIFIAIDSEADHLPVGNERKYWSSDALQLKDQEIKRVGEFYFDQVIMACKQLISRFEKSL
jgi:hypothetical protein